MSTAGTIAVLPNGNRVVFGKRLSEATAKKRALALWRKMKAKVNDPVQHAVESFERFNFKAPKHLDTIGVDLNTPLIRIGKVGELHYESSKEGKPTHYVHFLRKKGEMYGHPRGKFFVTIAPSTRVQDWLTETKANPQQRLKQSMNLATFQQTTPGINPPRSQQLTRGNIEKATQRYEELSNEAKARITDKRSYIMKIAWQIQRGRLTGYGHK